MLYKCLKITYYGQIWSPKEVKKHFMYLWDKYHWKKHIMHRYRSWSIKGLNLFLRLRLLVFCVICLPYRLHCFEACRCGFSSVPHTSVSYHQYTSYCILSCPPSCAALSGWARCHKSTLYQPVLVEDIHDTRYKVVYLSF